MTAVARSVRRAALVIAAMAGMFPGWSARAERRADAYPVRPVIIVVPYAAGGPMDLVARQLAVALKDRLGATVMVENHGGAGGTIGSQRVTRAAADGYTLLLHHVGLATVPALYPSLKLDPRRDLVPLALVSEVPMMVVVPAGSSIAGIDSLASRSRAGQLNWGTAGPGSASSLCMRLVGAAMRSRDTEVAYKGTGPALIDLMAGRVDAMCDLVTNLKPMLDSGKVVAVATVSERRNSSFPGVPALAEHGLSVASFAVWYGLFAPAGTPAPVVQALRRAGEAAVGDAAYRTALAGAGATVPIAADATATRLAERLSQDVARLRPLLAGAADARQ